MHTNSSLCNSMSWIWKHRMAFIWTKDWFKKRSHDLRPWFQKLSIKVSSISANQTHKASLILLHVNWVITNKTCLRQYLIEYGCLRLVASAEIMFCWKQNACSLGERTHLSYTSREWNYSTEASHSRESLKAFLSHEQRASFKVHHSRESSKTFQSREQCASFVVQHSRESPSLSNEVSPSREYSSRVAAFHSREYFSEGSPFARATRKHSINIFKGTCSLDSDRRCLSLFSDLILVLFDVVLHTCSNAA